MHTNSELAGLEGGNVKRVASAVGEGSISIAFVHQVLSEQETTDRSAQPV